jgi:methylthioribulose-1-phosphate dehydratase
MEAGAGRYNRASGVMKSRAFNEIAERLAQTGRRFDARGWVLGTSGNFSAVLARDPLRVAVTPSSMFKGELRPEQILEVDERGSVVGEIAGRASAEVSVHLEIVRVRNAGAVLHTHSVWSTVLSDLHYMDGGVAIEGYEMLKGLEGVRTHEHREWLPIVENDQDTARLARVIGEALRRHPGAHGALIRRHGLYTWGDDLAQAIRHVEILEFLLEASGRALALRKVVADPVPATKDIRGTRF